MAAPITNPRELDLPEALVEALSATSEDGAKLAKQVLDNLTPDGAREFVVELLSAVVEAQTTGDLRPVHDSILAWFRTLILRGESTYQEGAQWVESFDPETDPGETTDDLRNRLDLPPPRRRAV